MGTHYELWLIEETQDRGIEIAIQAKLEETTIWFSLNLGRAKED
jgi:hypothetical protein